MDKLSAAAAEVPKVRDGEPLGTITLIAVGSGILAACLLLILITSMVVKEDKQRREKETRHRISSLCPEGITTNGTENDNEKTRQCYTNVVFSIDSEKMRESPKAPSEIRMTSCV